jgi:hypothetical protein
MNVVRKLQDRSIFIAGNVSLVWLVAENNNLI